MKPFLLPFPFEAREKPVNHMPKYKFSWITLFLTNIQFTPGFYICYNIYELFFFLYFTSANILSTMNKIHKKQRNLTW